MKPKAQEKFQAAHSADLVLYDAAVRYLDILKSGNVAITPKKWRAERAQLTARKNELYEKMKVMREDIKAVEQSRKTADHLAKTEKTKDKEHEI